MSNGEIEIKRRILLMFFIVLVALIGVIFFNFQKTEIHIVNQGADTKSLEAKFAVLNTANSNSCGGTFDFVDGKLEGDRIQGSCCGPMNFHRYTEQIESLNKYSKFK